MMLFGFFSNRVLFFIDDAQGAQDDYEDFDYDELQFVTVLLLEHVTVEHGDVAVAVNVEMGVVKALNLYDDEIVEVVAVDADEESVGVGVDVAAVVVVVAAAVAEVEVGVEILQAEAVEVVTDVDVVVEIVVLHQSVEDANCSQK
jgi:hypothetical protein